MIAQLILSAGILFGGMTLIGLVAMLLKNTGVVDIMWGLGITGVAWGLYAQNPSLLGLISASLVSCWGVRLAGFLYITRIRKGLHDRRYTELEAKWTRFKPIRILGHFYMQAGLQLPICLALFPVMAAGTVSPTLFISAGIIIVVLALVCQSIADWQLYAFTQSKDAGGVCRVGFWGISRHPNYFFECLIWLGIAMLSVGLPNGLIALIGPITIWIIVRYITGPYTETLSLQKRGAAFRAYQQSVPMIIPRF